MAKQLNVNLAFNADTGKAKAQIQDLQHTLNNLVKTSAASNVNAGKTLTKDLMEAQVAASKLQTVLNQSMNMKTGNLDLTKFSEGLNKAGLKIEDLGRKLDKLGPEGQKAFMSLTQSIVAADVPLRRTNQLVSEMWTTMKNTARWQLSSSVLHGFMGSLQQAMGYARDLDQSLNDIRIVTNASADEMAAFADRANKAAKALSATTTQYTKASLIFYQQGLSDSEVQERADITLKMAHASGQSAEIVSDQLTAVWNNFAKGGENLEHYADVMTKLGAATASSSDEIAGGLEKFASIADMIGLSYEYAASALATITATTRQSEDVVGTALKTIFARIQGLNLGETLDDGTTLNKYSQALEKVGISIFEQNGELKAMDSILNEIGGKWETLNKDQQVALAQTVAGVRQYNQLVALFDDWDFFQENLNLSMNADGALQEQADIYAESWQAARDRVKAAAQDIYDSILDPDFFITFLNLLEDVLSGIANLTDALGGLPGVLSLLGVIGTKVFSEQLAGAVERMAFNIKSFVGLTQKAANDLQQAALKAATNIQFNTGTEAGDKEAQILKNRLQLQNQIKEVAQGMSKELQEQLQSLLQINEAYGEQLIKAAQNKDKTGEELQKNYSNTRTKVMRQGGEQGLEQFEQGMANMKEVVRRGEYAQSALNKLNTTIDDGATYSKKYSRSLKQVEGYLELVGRPKAAEQLRKVHREFKEGTKSGADLKKVLNGLVNENVFAEDTSRAAADALRDTVTAVKLESHEVDQLTNSFIEDKKAQEISIKANETYQEQVEGIKNKIAGFQGAVDNFGKKMVMTAQGISQITMGLTSLKSAWDTLKNEDLSIGEKVLQITMSLSMAIPALAMGITTLKEAQILKTAADLKSAAVGLIEAAATDRQAVAAGNATVMNAGFIKTLYAKAAAALMAKLGVSALTAGILTLGGAIAGIIAIATILVTIFEAIKNASPEAQMEKLKDKAEKSSQAFDRVTNSINETNEALQGLESSYDIINNLTKGTTEWHEAISKANSEVLELLKLYPELSEHIYQEDGILKISESGKQLIDNINQQRLNGATNVKLNDEIAVQEQGMKNSYNSYSFDKQNVGNNAILAERIQELYNNPRIGELLFSDDAISEQVYEGLQATGNLQGISLDQFQDSLEENQKIIRENATKQKSIDLLREQQSTLVSSSLGSTRDAEELKEIGVDYSKAYSTTRDRIENNKISEGGFGNWKSSDKYMESDPQWKMIQDFVRAQGDGAEYVGQENGEMVIKIGEEELSFSQEEVYDSLASLYSGEELETQIANGLSKTLSKAIGRSIHNASAESLVQADEFRKGIVSALEGTEYEDQADSIFKTMYNSYNTYHNANGQIRYKSSEDTMADIQADTQYVDFESGEFSNLVLQLNEGKIKAFEFTEEVKKLNAEGQIAASGDYFAEMAEGLGLDEEAAADMQNYAQHLRELADDPAVEGLADSLASDANAASDLAVEIFRMNKGIEDLAEGFEDWNSALTKSEKTSEEYAKAMSSIKKPLSDILDVEEEFVSDDFVTNHLKEIELAAQGNEDAINSLRSAMDEEMIAKVGVGQTEEFQQQLQTLDNKVKSELDRINTELPDIEVGAVLQDEGFLEAANALVKQSGMTADEANAYFAGIGYEPVYSVTDIENANNLSTPSVSTTLGVDAINWTEVPIDLPDWFPGDHNITLPSITYSSKPADLPPVESEAPARLMSFSGDQSPPEIKGLRKKADAGMSNYSSSNSGGKSLGGKKGGGGGGKSKGKPPKKVKDTDVLDRYKEITDQLDDVTDAFDDASKAADRLYGAARIKEMNKQISLLDKEIDLLEQKKVKASEYLAIDRAALDKAAKEVGISFDYDDKLNIKNYEEQMLPLYERLNTLVMAAGAEVDEAEQEQIDALQEKITALRDAIAQYDQTVAEHEDAEQAITDKKYEKEDLIYDELQYRLELKIEIEEASMRRLEYLGRKWAEDFTKLAETAALMYSVDAYDKSDSYRKQLDIYGESEDELRDKYKAGLISQDKYIAGLKEIRDGYYENLEGLIELDNQMRHFYEDTLAAGADELADYTDHMEHLTGVFDHYLNLMDMLGKNKDFDAMGDFLGGKADTVRDRLNVAKEYYEALLDQKSDVEQKLNKAIQSGDEESIKWWQDQWDAIVDATDEAQEQVLALTEDWVESMALVIENNMAKIKDTLEKSLTDGMGFDFLMDEFDRLNTRQEEYLTKTNQIYETNKLIRQASQKIDQTDNKVAKQKMQNFVAETKALQESNQLSNYELEIQQAKYDLLLAEIALEEAQNAKSTVRMQRDSEGNFGYVYTADQDAISDAEQGVDDAENRLYNLSLEGQKEYTEKYLQAMQDMNDELNEVWDLYYNQKVISEEEMNEQIDAIYAHYYGEGGVFQTYSHLYNIAVQTDADATADFWGKKYGEMTQHTADWQMATDEYLVAVEEQTQVWAEVSEQANEDVKNALDDSKTATKELTEESDKLAKEIKRDVIPTLKTEYDQVLKNVEAYEKERDAIREVIEAYEDRMAQIDSDVASETEDRLDDDEEKQEGAKYDKNFDYAEWAADYLYNKGGKQTDQEYIDKMKARDAKILDGYGSSESYGGSRFDTYISDPKNQKKILGLATGGFTGVWGPEGKLAFLHEKELVLNADDTENMLATVTMIRELVGMIDAGAAGSMLSGLLSTPGFTNMLNHDFQQKVEIYAEFPSATDHTEIEQAFNNLLNTASQYANRK